MNEISILPWLDSPVVACGVSEPKDFVFVGSNPTRSSTLKNFEISKMNSKITKSNLEKLPKGSETPDQGLENTRSTLTRTKKTEPSHCPG